MHLECDRRTVRRGVVDGIGAGRMTEVVEIGREHRWCGRRADAEDGQHKDRGRDADEPKGPTRSPATPEACLAGERPGLGLTQPAVDALLLRQVLDAVRDPAGL